MPIGVFIDSLGNVGLEEGLSSGTSLGSAGAALSLTGRAEGDGGMPKVSLGVRVPLLLRPPGTGGRRSGTGDDIVVLMCGCDRLKCVDVWLYCDANRALISCVLVCCPRCLGCVAKSRRQATRDSRMTPRPLRMGDSDIVCRDGVVTRRVDSS